MRKERCANVAWSYYKSVSQAEIESFTPIKWSRTHDFSAVVRIHSPGRRPNHLQLPTRFGKYELEQFIGGGTAHVYLATDSQTRSKVAVHILNKEACADPDVKARFVYEATVGSRLQHPNIIRMFEHGEDDGKPFMVLEYLLGVSLRDAIKTGETGDTQSKLRIALQVARALEYLHSQDIVHGNLRPENIHIDAEGKVKLKHVGAGHPSGSNARPIETPYFVSPEQLNGHPATPESDVYSFGLILFELFAGVRAIPSDSYEKTAYRILNEPIDLEPLERADAPERIAQIVQNATRRKPEERPSNFTKMSRDLEEVSRTLPSSPPRRFKGSLLVLTLMIIIAIGVGGLVYLKQNATATTLPPILNLEAGQMFLVPAGPFPQGASNTGVTLPAFYMDRTEVTNSKYQEFCSATNRSLPPDFPKDSPGLPVVNVTFEDAESFAKWAGKRLPRAIEWEKAARGTEGKTWPWGQANDPKLANVADNPNFPERKPIPSISMPEAATPYNLLHMAGNVREFVTDDAKPNRRGIKGGSFLQPLQAGLPWNTSDVPAGFFAADTGFRCAKDAPR